MNVEEMVARIRELSIVGSTALLPVISSESREYLEAIEVKDGKLVLTFTNPYADINKPDITIDFEESDRYDNPIDF